MLFPLIFSSPANLQQRLLGFMRPDGASSQQVQQELQRKYHSESWIQASFFPLNIFFITLYINVGKETQCKFFFFFPLSFPFPAKAQVYEKVSLQAIQQLVHRSYQTLALWKLLCDHQFSLIMSELPKVHMCTANRCSYPCSKTWYSIEAPRCFWSAPLSFCHFLLFAGVSRADEGSKF